MSTVKRQKRRAADSMPKHATWDDRAYEYYVKKKLEQALKEAAVGAVIPHENVKQHLFSK